MNERENYLIFVLIISIFIQFNIYIQLCNYKKIKKYILYNCNIIIIICNTIAD